MIMTFIIGMFLSKLYGFLAKCDDKIDVHGI